MRSGFMTRSANPESYSQTPDTAGEVSFDDATSARNSAQSATISFRSRLAQLYIRTCEVQTKLSSAPNSREGYVGGTFDHYCSANSKRKKIVPRGKTSVTLHGMPR